MEIDTVIGDTINKHLSLKYAVFLWLSNLFNFIDLISTKKNTIKQFTNKMSARN
ncbi:hypothetical protein EV146_11825 [Mesobacillus foraminis]|uniref:Uncharacterized protein n=1 Tax=Mesobacillus foraminis TaxID=279826 RepID=A0A4R2AXZ4_9BACI|nr:hypothetical protein EV146_11825 [Mesobacillus foraminis]